MRARGRGRVPAPLTGIVTSTRLTGLVHYGEYVNHQRQDGQSADDHLGQRDVSFGFGLGSFPGIKNDQVPAHWTLLGFDLGGTPCSHGLVATWATEYYHDILPIQITL